MVYCLVYVVVLDVVSCVVDVYVLVVDESDVGDGVADGYVPLCVV